MYDNKFKGCVGIIFIPVALLIFVLRVMHRMGERAYMDLFDQW